MQQPPQSSPPAAPPRKRTTKFALRPLSDAVTHAAMAAFDGWVHPKANAAMGVAGLSANYARIDASNRALVIESRAILYAAIKHGESARSKTSRWLVEWLSTQKPLVLRSLKDAAANLEASPDDVADWLDKGLAFTLSGPLQASILPTAVALAELTVGRELADLRHIMVAMLADPGQEWPLDTGQMDFGTGAFMSSDDFARLTEHIAIKTIESPEKAEDVSIWKLLQKQPLMQVLEYGAQETSDSPDSAMRPTPLAADFTGFQTDDPASVDHLNRAGFSKALIKIIVQAQDKNSATAKASTSTQDRNHAFMVHLNGPWGTGKSSVLNFIRDGLRAENPAWLVVDFNAWKLQRLEPPWWTVISQIQKAAEEQAENYWQRDRIWWAGQRSRLRFLGAPMAVGLALVALTLLLGWWQLSDQPDEFWKGLGAIITGIGAVFAFSQRLVFGQSKTVQTFEALQSDPYRPIMAQFERLVGKIDRPVIVLIDDLDRCDGAYVVSLIEGIQTMLRGVPITYLVAADRQWVCTSFEKRYKDFEGQAPDAGRPLGYLFLEKIFQISTAMPVMSDALRQAYWDRLLRPINPEASTATLDDKQVQEEADSKVASLDTHEQFVAAIDEETEETPRKQALRTAVAQRVAAPAAVAEAEHRLQRYPSLMDRNPRGMKRLVSAVTMNRSRLFSEGRTPGLIEIARWTAIELRWPLLAEHLADKPDLLSRAGDTQDGVLKLLGQDTVVAVTGKKGDEGHLTEAVLRAIVE